MSAAPLDWTRQLLDQLTWHWGHHARPRLGGLTDDEYLWEPAPGAWSIRPASTSHAAGGGAWVADFAFPEPDPAPVTTIAWRLGHVIVGVFGCAMPPISAARRSTTRPLHINREAIDHLAEVLLLRDLYRHRPPG